MENSNVEKQPDRLFTVLKYLNLTEKYPGRLTREEMYQISECSLFNKLPKCQKDLASYFLHKIARYDYTAREFCIVNEDNKSSTPSSSHTSKFRKNMKARAQSKRELDISPLDIIIAVFLCCDDISRQDLASHMWSCRLAIPLVIQEKEPPILPMCFLWPLRNIVMKWEKHHDGNITVREGRLVKESFTSIAFLRVGELRLSKSALINSVISTTEKTHSIFFHRDCPGSTTNRYLVDGLIDISWYFPTPKSEGKITDHFEDPVTFLNLHGDNYQFDNYLPLLSRFANIVVVMSQVEYLDRCRLIIKPCIDMGKTVLVILTDQNIQDKDEATIDNFTENLNPSEDQMEYLEVVDKQRAELVNETRSVLMKMVKSRPVCLETACSGTDMSVDENVDEFRNTKIVAQAIPVCLETACSGTDMSVDENVDEFRSTKKAAQAISKLLKSIEPTKRKQSFLPLQHEPWINWAAADKERLRATHKKKNEDYQNYKAHRDMVMKKSRQEQLEILKKREKTELVDIYLNSISTSNSKERKLFLRWLKFEIDDLSREELSPVYREYHEIMQRLTELRETEKETLNTLKSRLKELDNEVASRSFGMEHIMREIGQIYEVLHEEGNQHLYRNYDLPDLAAKILLDGYPVELLDGYVNSVPIQWVSDMLRKLEKNLKRSARIKVITVLGIQSAGKSTMLNALFGCQYAVSAGRCTRGAYCQIIEVEETYSKTLGIDYVLAIDTEGLRAPELSASGQMVKHDNELSTFVIGIGDLTILTLMGENTTYLDDLLPISVLAFLRMEVTTNFRPKCIIVHQNVNKEDQQKLLQQGRILEDTLNRMTHTACKVERIEIKSFKEIIAFDVGRDVRYLPALLEGSKPMAPISTRYCEELNVLKQTLVTNEAGTSNNTMATFIKHLENIWTAIKKDDFVYQFSNAIETEARMKLDDYWCDASWNFRQPAHTIMSNGYIKIQNTEDASGLESVIRDLKTDIRRVITEEHSRQKEAFSTFISKTDDILKETMLKWSVDMDKRFDDLNNELLRETSDKLGEYEQDRKRKFSVKNHKLQFKDTMKTNIEELVNSVKSSKQESLNETKIVNLFECHWKQWKSKLVGESPTCPTSIDIENDAYDALCRAFPSGIDALNQYLLEKKCLSSYDFDDFQVNKLLTKSQVFSKTIHLRDNTEIIKFKTTLFSKVKSKLDSREAIYQPYSRKDIDEVVQNVKDHFQNSMKDIVLQPKHEVYLAVLACGHAIKRMQKLHEKYESENSLANMLEKEKEYCLRVFKALCNETEKVDLLVTECREILRDGILNKMTQTLPDMIEIDMRCIPLTSKSLIISDCLIQLAKKDSFDMFQRFILEPYQSITDYIYECIDRYASQPKLQEKFGIKLETIKGEVGQALEKSFVMGKPDFQTWRGIFHEETKDRIVIEHIDRLDELGKGETFDLAVFFQKVSQCLETIIQEIKNDMTSYLDKNFQSIKKVVMERFLTNIIGCTEGCPFCGAICMVAYQNHAEQHFTTLHRPKGCTGRHYLDTGILVIGTCPEALSTDDLFSYSENGVQKWCSYKTYAKVHPRWKITTDATGEETSYWNCFFAKYAGRIAGKNKKVPDIPASWKLLEWKTEIQILQNKMK